MSEHRMAAIFFIPMEPDSVPPSLHDLVTRAGMDQLLPESGPVTKSLYGQTEVVFARWGVMESVYAHRQILAQHVCLQVFPHRNDLLDRQIIGNPEAAMPIAETFRDACVALQPDAAMLYTGADRIEPEYLDAQYPFVLGLDGILLDKSYSALLYLNAEIASYFPKAYHAGRDQLPAGDGLLLFRGTGDDRWW